MFDFFGKYTETAPATVLAARLLHTTGLPERQGGIYEFVLEVQPATGVPFRTTTKFNCSAMTRVPLAGSVINVKYNPKTQKAKPQLKGDPRYNLTILAHTLKQEAEQRRADLLSSAPGTPVPPNATASAQIIEQMMRKQPPKSGQ